MFAEKFMMKRRQLLALGLSKEGSERPRDKLGLSAQNLRYSTSMFRSYKSMYLQAEGLHSSRKSKRSNSRKLSLAALISLVVFWGSAAMAVLPTTYYASPNGNSSNSGLSTSSAWPLDYALANGGVSNTIMLLDGNYSVSSPLTPQPYQTVKAINKWGPKFYNVSGNTFYAGNNVRVDGVTIDGLSFSNCDYYPIYFTTYGMSNITVRNCWIRNTGQSASPSSGASAIQVYPGTGVLIERNLLEYNGTSNPHFNHGIYGGGTNGVYRFNVCRYNGGYGIVLDQHFPTGDKNNQIYGNLCYGNAGGGSQHDQISCYNDTASAPLSGLWTNYIWGNTVVSDSTAAIWCQDGAVMLTNNIIISTRDGIMKYSSFTSDLIMGDYNLGPQAFTYGSGLHDVISGAQNFASSANGLFWLVSGSPARNRALPGVYSPVDFFGNVQSSVNDIGAFPYNTAWSSDTRVLDPSPANPDYWANLSGTNSGSASISVTPPSYDYGTIPVGTTADVSFVVQNNGSTSLSGNATVPAPFSIVSGGAYTLGPGQTQTVGVRYSPTVAETDTQTVTFTGGTGANVGVSGSAISPPPPGSLTFQAESGVLTSPMVSGGGYIYQAVDTVATNGGQAVYTFTLTNQGSYIIEAVVNATDTSHNSFYVNIDAQPQDPTMIWDITPTTGFEQRTVSWRGNGTDLSDQFVPEIFSLAAGTHQLIIVGRESNTQLQQLTIMQLPPAPANLRITAIH